VGGKSANEFSGRNSVGGVDSKAEADEGESAGVEK